MSSIRFLDNNGTFAIKNPENSSYLYLPLAGENGIRSSITPTLGGDSKLDQNHFLLEPVSAENLHNNKGTRNFWCRIEGKGIWSVSGSSAEQEADKFTERQDESELEAGFMWQKLTRISRKFGIKAETTSFVTLDGNAEVSLVSITNNTEETLTVTPIAAIPIYGRSADNIRDHRHVTSLLHRTKVTESAIIVKPVLSFDERGHQKNNTTYFVGGFCEDGSKPVDFYPSVTDFIGEGGSFYYPEAVRIAKEGRKPGYSAEGKESVGAFAFETIRLKAKESASYIVILGAADDSSPDAKIKKVLAGLSTKEAVEEHLKKIKTYWTDKVNVAFYTGDSDRDNYLKWISFQPILRRIFGCSFLPYHDYGKGGRGWRDLWQDCLALLIMDPVNVRKMIVDNYSGVRMDGTNATIIGSKQGEFIADRNNITRVWMDHAFWPFNTTKLYMDQTGDMDILLEKVPYFKDLQSKRGTAHDDLWTPAYGSLQKTKGNEIYHGTVLEHILLENLCAFYDVGEHNIIRLHGADWNDALDMASARGESVAFTSAYAGNLQDIADTLKIFAERSGIDRVEIAEELKILFASGENLYNDIAGKQKLLANYIASCSHNISGNRIVMRIADICTNLEEKANWLMEHIRACEWIKDEEGKGWFNGYYDNSGNPVERSTPGDVRMMLTGQVFAIMSGTATEEQIVSITKSADQYLYDKNAGGYRLNTNFHEEKFDFGRQFGFAYGEKENGAVFSHMAVMYGNALYKRGHAKEGYKVLKTLLDTAMDFKVSRMYPGLPEYFDNDGRGLYAYLTGASSWYMLTMMNEVYGIKGDCGDLVIRPALCPEQFDAEGKASLCMEFAGKKLEINIYNTMKIDCEEVSIAEASLDGVSVMPEEAKQVRIPRKQLTQLSVDERHVINVVIG